MSKKYTRDRPNVPAEIRRAVEVEAGHTCIVKNCGEHTYLELHHINDNREDNRVENLALLCDKHHKMAHAGVIDRKSLREYKKLLNVGQRFDTPLLMIYQDGVIKKNQVGDTINIDLAITVLNAGISEPDVRLLIIEEIQPSTFQIVFERGPFSQRGMKIAKDHKYVTGLGSHPAGSRTKLYLYLNGTYRGLDGSQAFTIDDVYEYDPGTQSTSMPPDKVKANIKSVVNLEAS